MLHVYWGLSCGILDNNSLALLMEPDVVYKSINAT